MGEKGCKWGGGRDSFTGRGSLSDVGNSIKITRINVLLQTKKSGN